MSSDLSVVTTIPVSLGRFVFELSHLYYVADLGNWKGYLEKGQNKFFWRNHDMGQVCLCVYMCKFAWNTSEY